MTDIQWGDPIAVDGKRPEWFDLPEGPLGYKRLDEKEWFGPGSIWGENDIEGVEGGWSSVTHIILPANHPYYLATSRGFKYWSGKKDAPSDWDGKVVLRRGGMIRRPEPWVAPFSHNQRWFHEKHSAFADIIGYNKKVEQAAVPLPADWAFQEAMRRIPLTPKYCSPTQLVDRIRTNGTWAELARMIEKYEPHLAPVDPDVLAVREILADRSDAMGYPEDAEEYRTGQGDSGSDFVASLAAYRRVVAARG